MSVRKEHKAFMIKVKKYLFRESSWNINPKMIFVSFLVIISTLFLRLAQLLVCLHKVCRRALYRPVCRSIDQQTLVQANLAPNRKQKNYIFRNSSNKGIQSRGIEFFRFLEPAEGSTRRRVYSNQQNFVIQIVHKKK